MTNEDQGRFGLAEHTFLSAQKCHGYAPTIRIGMLYAPTEAEITVMAPYKLRIVLTEWMYESPVGLIPSAAQIRHVKATLERRQDSATLVGLIDACRTYIGNEPC